MKVKKKMIVLLSKPGHKALTAISTCQVNPFFQQLQMSDHISESPGLESDFLSHCYKILNGFLMNHIKAHHSCWYEILRNLQVYFLIHPESLKINLFYDKIILKTCK